MAGHTCASAGVGQRSRTCTLVSVTVSGRAFIATYPLLTIPLDAQVGWQLFAFLTVNRRNLSDIADSATKLFSDEWTFWKFGELVRHA